MRPGNGALALMGDGPDYDDTEACGWCMEDLNFGQRHPVCDRLTDARTCERCQTVFMDSEPGEPCERCGGPLGVTA